MLCASVESIKKSVLKPFYPEVRIPVTKGLLQALIEHLSTHLQHQMRTLFFVHCICCFLANSLLRSLRLFSLG